MKPYLPHIAQVANYSIHRMQSQYRFEPSFIGRFTLVRPCDTDLAAQQQG